MIVLAINVRSGGKATTADRLVERCASHNPDAVVFSEYRDTPAGERLRAAAERAGWRRQAWTEGHRGNGVLIAAREAFEGVRNPFGLSDDDYPDGVLLARFEQLDLYGVYLPGQDRKRPHLRCLIAAAQRYNERGLDGACVGDFNSGRNQTDIEINVRTGRLADEFSTADLYADLERYWTEAWLYLHPDRREYSWFPFRIDPNYPARNGWRIDKAFVSASLLPKVRSAAYDHGFRTERLTDHSALVTEFDL
ncbi:MAG: endonuclease/exonuclease/phosphatase family protein [Candidatus Tumulicola sp.]